MAKLHAPDAKPAKQDVEVPAPVLDAKPSKDDKPVHDGKPKAAAKNVEVSQAAPVELRRGPPKRLRPVDETTGCKITGIS